MKYFFMCATFIFYMCNIFLCVHAISIIFHDCVQSFFMCAIIIFYVWIFSFLFNNAEISFVQYWIENSYFCSLVQNIIHTIPAITRAERITPQLRLLRKRACASPLCHEWLYRETVVNIEGKAKAGNATQNMHPPLMQKRRIHTQPHTLRGA